MKRLNLICFCLFILGQISLFAEIVWTGANGADIFDEDNWDLSNSLVEVIDPNFSIDDDVIIKDGEIETITSNNKTKITSKDFFINYGFVPTINELYKIFEEIIIFINPDVFSINYDNKFKYPKSAFFDYRSCVLDEESCWQVDDLKIIDSLMPKKMYNDGVVATFIRC